MRALCALANALALAALALASAHAAEPDFIIYTYDALVADGGLGPAIFPEFEKICHCHVRALASGDSSQILNRLEIDSKRAAGGAQLVLGLDEQLWKRAKPFLADWGAWVPRGLEKVSREMRIGNGFLPFDYGIFAFMADEKALAAQGLKAPESLADLAKPEWRRKILLEDPRTSAPGMAFLLYTREALGAGAGDYWRSLTKQWLTLAPGWSSAYGLFLKEAAPLVWSYTTSQAYHDEHPGKEAPGRYRALLFREGQPMQIEGAAWVKSGTLTEADRERAKLFLEFLLSPAVQTKIALANWMLPVVEGTATPASFAKLPQVKHRLRLEADAGAVEGALTDWERSVH